MRTFKPTSFLTPTLLGLLGFVLLSSVSALPVVRIDFSGDVENQPPETSKTPSPDGIYTRPTNLVDPDGEVRVVEGYRSGDACFAGKAVFLPHSAELIVAGAATSFEEGRDVEIAFSFIYDTDKTIDLRNGVRVNLFNRTASSEGLQAAFLFGAKTVDFISGAERHSFFYASSPDTMQRVRLRMLYSKGIAEVIINDTPVGEAKLDAAEVRGFRVLQFTRGSSASQYAVMLSQIEATPLP